MASALTPPTEWGVRYTASVNTDTHVDPKANEGAARVFLGALHFCGNSDAVLVCRCDGGPWQLPPHSGRLHRAGGGR